MRREESQRTWGKSLEPSENQLKNSIPYGTRPASNPSRIRGRRALSPLHNPCSPSLFAFLTVRTECFLTKSDKFIDVTNSISDCKSCIHKFVNQYTALPVELEIPEPRAVAPILFALLANGKVIIDF